MKSIVFMKPYLVVCDVNPAAGTPRERARSQRADDKDVGKVRQNFVAKDSLRAYAHIRPEHNEVRELRHWKQCEFRHTMASMVFSKLQPRSTRAQPKTESHDNA